jgi:F0F1-type ATP synthase assembly protein I
MSKNDEILRNIEKELQKNNSSQIKPKADPKKALMDTGIDILSGIGVGLFIGFYVDKFAHTRPLFIIVCTLLGLFGGLKNMMRRVKNS